MVRILPSVSRAFAQVIFFIFFGLMLIGSYSFADASLGRSAEQTQEVYAYIEPYCHNRDYAGLYKLFNENTNNLGCWHYSQSFPGDNQIKVARLEDQLAGFVIYNKRDNQGSIDYIAVDQTIRSSGLGRLLLNHAVYDLKEQGAQSVSLCVFEHNKKAQTLYERLGFCMQSAYNGLMNYSLALA